jgi:hypothetical protein
MSFLLAEQAWWDKREFDPADGYERLPVGDEKILHIHTHVSKAAFKLLDGNREFIVREVIPDLAIYRSQLMNQIDLVPEDVEQGMPVFETMPLRAVVRANGYLAKYLEPRMHGDTVPHHPIKRAAEYLHGAATMLADDYDVNLEQAQRERMELRLGGPLPEVV